MNFSKLFLVFSLISLVAHMPIQAAGLAYKPAALMAAASTASAVLANGIIAIADSIKTEKLFDLRAQVIQLSKENDSLSLNNHDLQGITASLKDSLISAQNQVKEQFPLEIVAFATVVVGVILLVALLDKKLEIAPQGSPVADKEELTTQA
ncbi:hypothetical protein BH09DEP1_BH09DEP1_8620 [soil metagenome]